MVTGIIGRKVGMTQVFAKDGTVIAGDRHQGRAVRRRPGEDGGDRRLRGGAARPGRRAAGAGRASRWPGTTRRPACRRRACAAR